MKTQDVIEQLIGGAETSDQLGDTSFMFGKPEKFPQYTHATVDFDNGVLLLENYDCQTGDVVDSAKYAIRATLEPITE